MNVIFLDFDGVVNIPYWTVDEKGKYNCCYNYPHDGTINSFQAIQWVSEFCEKYNYSIVVSSTWREYDFDCKKCLYNSGLRKSIEVLGNTPIFDTERGLEITAWLNEHKDVDNYLIFDDDSDMTVHMDRLVKCNSFIGFTLREYDIARKLHEKFSKSIDK